MEESLKKLATEYIEYEKKAKDAKQRAMKQWAYFERFSAEDVLLKGFVDNEYWINVVKRVRSS